MRNFFGFILFCIWAIFARYFYVCEIKNHCNPEPPKTTISLLSGDKVILENYDDFLFTLNSINPDLSENNNLFLDRTADYLINHPNVNLNINGLYTPQEAALGRGIFENLGLARAAVVRNLLTQRSVEENQLTLDFGAARTNEMKSLINFLIDNKSADSGNRFLAYHFFDMTYSGSNFDNSATRFNPGKECRTYLDSLVNYLSEHPDKTLKIITHTDATGDEVFKEELGTKRAKAVAAYLIGLEVENPVITETRGSSEPVTLNGQVSGKSKNSRVNFLVPIK